MDRDRHYQARTGGARYENGVPGVQVPGSFNREALNRTRGRQSPMYSPFGQFSPRLDQINTADRLGSRQIVSAGSTPSAVADSGQVGYFDYRYPVSNQEQPSRRTPQYTHESQFWNISQDTVVENERIGTAADHQGGGPMKYSMIPLPQLQSNSQLAESDPLDSQKFTSISPVVTPGPLDAVQQLEQELAFDRQLLDVIEPRPEPEDPRARCRLKYKPKSSIPPDISSAHYAAQCIASAISSRLPPYRLHPGEYNILRNYLSHRHVTTYLNIRNGILRLWLSNPTVNVTRVEAAGCVRHGRYYGLAEFAFEWLLRNGFINHGCIELPLPDPIYQPRISVVHRRKPRQTIAIVGAGIAGLACARQLEALVQRYKPIFTAKYEDVPRIVVLEGRRRIGGRIYSVNLGSSGERPDSQNSSSTPNEKAIAELGAGTLRGFGGGNPLGVVVRRQLGLPVVPVDPATDLYVGKTGVKVDATRNYRAHELFAHMFDRLHSFESGMPAPVTAAGDRTLIRAARDPNIGDDGEEAKTIAKMEEHERPYDDPGVTPPPQSSMTETAVEVKFLKELGFSTVEPQRQIHISSLPLGGAGSLGKTMEGFVTQLADLTKLSEQDLEALAWYFAKFEYIAGGNIDNMSLSSFSHYRQNRFTGLHSWIRDGFTSFARGLAMYPSKLDIRFKTRTTVIEYDQDSTLCCLENGEQVAADRVVVTVPLGVLKKRSLQFIPDLPQWKADSIERLEFGVANKVCLLFSKAFWGSAPTIHVAQDVRNLRGNCFMFENIEQVCGVPLIVGLMSGEAAKQLANESDDCIVEGAVAQLKKLFPQGEDVKLIESVVTHWQLDPWSLGTHSYVGVDGTVVDHDLLGRPVLQSLYFAGEATSRQYPGTVHGAYLSGLRAAKEVINSLIGPIEIPEPLIPEENRESRSASASVGPVQSRGSAPGETNLQRGTSVPLRGGSGVGTPTGIMPNASYYGQYQPLQPTSLGSGGHQNSIDVDELSAELSSLRHSRLATENSQMDRDMEKALGPRPSKPARGANTNPFLLFQKDYWDACRAEADSAKKQDKKGTRASRNEIRANLGRRWKTLPDDEKRPYIEQTRLIREENEQRFEDYIRKTKWYDSEADNFRQQWKLDHPSTPSIDEQRLDSLIEDVDPKRKRLRLRE